MPQLSAGILLYRRRAGALEVLLAHPGGPYWRSKDAGAWMIPKGGVEPGEDALAAALREFEEELGTRPDGAPWPLGRVRQAGGKWVEVFALEGEFEPAAVRSMEFEMEWPPKSGRYERFPEIDRAAWFSLPEALEMMLRSQLPLLDALQARAGGGGA